MVGLVGAGIHLEEGGMITDSDIEKISDAFASTADSIDRILGAFEQAYLQVGLAASKTSSELMGIGSTTVSSDYLVEIKDLLSHYGNEYHAAS